jgi:hypothetical protein
MGLRSQKYWLEPERLDGAVETTELMKTKINITPTGLIIADLPTTKPTGAGTAGALWNDGGTVKVSNGTP